MSKYPHAYDGCLDCEAAAHTHFDLDTAGWPLVISRGDIDTHPACATVAPASDAEEFAELLVHRANQYEPLLAALRAMLSCEYGTPEAYAAVRAARAAIAKAAQS